MLQSPYGDILPIFPCFYGVVTEDRFERAIERLCDRADKAYMAGHATSAQYEAWYKALVLWTSTIKMEA